MAALTTQDASLALVELQKIIGNHDPLSKKAILSCSQSQVFTVSWRRDCWLLEFTFDNNKKYLTLSYSIGMYTIERPCGYIDFCQVDDTVSYKEFLRKVKSVFRTLHSTLREIKIRKRNDPMEVEQLHELIEIMGRYKQIPKFDIREDEYA